MDEFFIRLLIMSENFKHYCLFQNLLFYFVLCKLCGAIQSMRSMSLSLKNLITINILKLGFI